jgi:hypothetical protein
MITPVTEAINARKSVALSDRIREDDGCCRARNRGACSAGYFQVNHDKITSDQKYRCGSGRALELSIPRGKHT